MIDKKQIQNKIRAMPDNGELMLSDFDWEGFIFKKHSPTYWRVFYDGEFIGWLRELHKPCTKVGLLALFFGML